MGAATVISPCMHGTCRLLRPMIWPRLHSLLVEVFCLDVVCGVKALVVRAPTPSPVVATTTPSPVVAWWGRGHGEVPVPVWKWWWWRQRPAGRAAQEYPQHGARGS